MICYEKKTFKELSLLVLLAIVLPLGIILIWNVTGLLFFEELLKTFCSTGWMVICTFLCYKILKTPFETLERPKKVRLYSTAVAFAWFISVGATILCEFTDMFFI